jgi:hypothetical protein
VKQNAVKPAKDVIDLDGETPGEGVSGLRMRLFRNANTRALLESAAGAHSSGEQGILI